MAEHGDGTEHQIRIRQYGFAASVPFFGNIIVQIAIIRDRTVIEKYPKQQQDQRQYDIWYYDTSDHLIKCLFFRDSRKYAGVNRGHSLTVLRPDNKLRYQKRRKDARKFVAYSDNADPPSGTVARSDGDNKRVRQCLKYGQRHTHQEQRYQEQEVAPKKGSWPKKESPKRKQAQPCRGSSSVPDMIQEN